MGRYAPERAESRPTAIIVTRAESSRRSHKEIITTPVTAEMERTTTTNMDVSYEDAATISPRERSYMEGGMLSVPTAQQRSRSSSRRSSQNSYLTLATSPSSVADSLLFDSSHDASSRQTDRNDMGHFTDASSPAYCHEQIPYRGNGTPLQRDFMYPVPVHNEPRASLEEGPIVCTGASVTDNVVSDNFVHDEVASGHVPLPPQPHEGHAEFDDNMTLMKSEPGMVEQVQYTNHREGAMDNANYPPVRQTVPNAPCIWLIGDQIVNKETPNGVGGVQLNGSVLVPTLAGGTNRCDWAAAPKPVDLNKKNVRTTHMSPNPVALQANYQAQTYWQENKDQPTHDMKPSASGDLKRVAVDRSDFHTPKRIRAGGGPDESNDTVDDSDSNSPTWACPFFRHDPLGNMDCLKLKLKRIRDVKQHIQRRHNKAGNYCPNCLRNFASRKKKDEHLNADNCETKDQSGSSSKGVLSSEAQAKLKHRALRSKSGDEQWHDVYDIVFKGQMGPDRKSLEPQLGTFIMETTRLMQSFWKNENGWFPEYLSRQPQDDLQVLVSNLMGEIHRRFEERIQGGSSSSPSRWDNSSAATLEPLPSTLLLPNTEPGAMAIPQITSGAGGHLQYEMTDRPSSIPDHEDVHLNYIDPRLDLTEFGVGGDDMDNFFNMPRFDDGQDKAT